MKFNLYLKSCREKYRLTQEELVQELYNFNDSFKGLEVGTLSRWERASTQPNIKKQILIIKLFQTKCNHTFPCFENMNREKIETHLCKTSLKNIIGHQEEYILNFPNRAFVFEDFEVKRITVEDDLESVLALPYDVIENLTGNVYCLSFEKLKEWALHPSNLFLHALYQDRFAGILFSLRLKPEIFERLINFQLDLKDVNDEDFASFEEMGCNFPIAFFAYSDYSLSMIALQFYTHLIVNQDFILKVGATPLLKGAKQIIKNMNMKAHKQKKVPQGVLESYTAPLSEVLINEPVIKMIFQKQECSED